MAVKYLSGNRIWGTNAERLAMTTAGSSPKTSWKELDRTTLGTDGTLTVSGFDAKDNLMILGHYKPVSGNVTSGLVLNSDTGDNYSNRRSLNGGTDVTVIDTDSKPCIQTDGGYGGSEFCYFVTTVRNNTDEEKLFITHFDGESDTGSGTAPNREESVGKWANTANQITTIQLTDADGDTAQEWASGSEVVVLGCDDDEADSGTNFWEQLVSFASTSSANTYDTTFTAKKYLWVEFYATNSGSIQPEFTLGSGGSVDRGLNYCSRGSVDGYTDWTRINEDAIESESNTLSPVYGSFFIINKSDTEKLAIGKWVGQEPSGSANPPTRRQVVGKWANTSAQANAISLEDSGSGTFTGCQFRVWGSN